MRHRLAMLILFLLLTVPEAVWAEDQPEADGAVEDEKVIAVLEILELMEMVEDMALFRDMEYLMEEDSNEPQK